MISMRIATICAILLSVIIFQVYSATIISFLTVDDSKLPFTDFETFVADGTYKMAAFRHPFFFSLFDGNRDKTVRKIREEHLISYDQFPKSNEESVDMLCNDEKLSILGGNYKFTQIWLPCKITLIPNELMRIHTGFELANDGIQCKELLWEM